LKQQQQQHQGQHARLRVQAPLLAVLMLLPYGRAAASDAAHLDGSRYRCQTL
jgi:hypothetical protein